MTQSTVKTHLAHVLDKLGCATGSRRSYGYEHGLIAAGSGD